MCSMHSTVHCITLYSVSMYVAASVSVLCSQAHTTCTVCTCIIIKVAGGSMVSLKTVVPLSRCV